MKKIYEWLKAKLNIRFVVRRLRIKLGMWNFESKLYINGAVDCSCGGQILSNTGKIIYDSRNMKISCRRCKKLYDSNEIYYERKEGQRVVFR
jgi:Zn finger protein HypA/HybF involved in hydrogenase expression